MTAETFNFLVRNPLDRSVSIGEIEEAVMEFPWCQPLRVLLSVRAHAEGRADRQQLLGQAAVHTFYRPRLRQLHEGFLAPDFRPSGTSQASGIKVKAAPEPDKKDLVAETIREATEFEPEPLPVPKPKPTKGVPVKDPAQSDDQTRLIDEFLANQGGARFPRKDAGTEPEGDLAVKSAKFDGLIISETMARMYVRQGQPEKAAYIVSQLSLKYPEKSAYFAQILETGGPEA